MTCCSETWIPSFLSFKAKSEADNLALFDKNQPLDASFRKIPVDGFHTGYQHVPSVHGAVEISQNGFVVCLRHRRLVTRGSSSGIGVVSIRLAGAGDLSEASCFLTASPRLYRALSYAGFSFRARLKSSIALLVLPVL